MYATPARSRRDGPRWLAAALVLAGGAVAVFLGVYGREHEPAAQRATSVYVWSIDFGSATAMLAFKSWFTTLALAFALLQLATGLRLRDRIRWPATVPLWLTDFHRLCGTLAVACSIPVAYHCLWSLGFQSSSSNPRAVVHSFLGCFFYGAFVAKVLGVRIGRVPTWFVPVLGGIVLVALTGIWVTSALVFFRGDIG
jgi:hypothetical protein